MRLDEFIQETGIPVARMADRCNLTFHQLYHVLKGGTPTLKTAIMIREYTKGRVQPEDLLPLEELQKISEQKKSK